MAHGRFVADEDDLLEAVATDLVGRQAQRLGQRARAEAQPQQPRLDDRRAEPLGYDVGRLSRAGQRAGQNRLGRDQAVEAGEALAVAGIGQGVEHHHAVARMVRAPPADEIGADEPGPAGDEKLSHVRPCASACPAAPPTSAARCRRATARWPTCR